MQTTSATYDRILAGTDCSYETQLVIDGVGTYGESDLMSISTSIEMFQEDPDIGRAISSEINVSMLNPSATIPTMARIRPQVKAKGTAPKSSKVTIVDEDLASDYATYSNENITFSSASGATVSGENLSFAVDSSEYLESEWIAQGIFYIDTREVTANNNGLDILTIHGFDAMLKTEQMYSSNATVGDNLDISYVQSIADAIGVEVDPRTWGIMQTGYMIPFPVGYSMREILGYIASAYAGCFIISDTGQLRLVALEDIEDETRFLIDEIGEIIVFGVDSPQQTVTASGAVATFTAGGEYALDELEIAIDPVQDLHGYDAPYPDGGGANVFPPTTISGSSHSVTVSTSDNIITLHGTADAYGQVLANSTFTLPSGTYYFKYFVVSGTGTVIPQLLSTAGTTTYVSGNNSFTLSEATEVKARVTYGSGTSFSNLKIKLMLSKGSTAPSEYADYSNICPISGHTGVTVEQSGKNLAYVFDDGYVPSTSTGQLVQYDGARTDYIKIEPSKPYYAKVDPSTEQFFIFFYDANKGFIRYNAGTEYISATSPSNAAYAMLRVSETQLANSQIQLEQSNQASTYEPYVGNTYPISWQTEAGTVYKGTLNVKTGVLTALWTIVTETSSTGWTGDAGGQRAYKWFNGIKQVTSSANKIEAISNYLVAKTQAQGITNKEQGMFFGTTNSSNVSVHINGVTDGKSTGAQVTSALNDYFASNPWQFCYALATPLTFQLSPTQVQTLLGQNNLWANSGNIINLEFVEPASEAVRILV